MPDDSQGIAEVEAEWRERSPSGLAPEIRSEAERHGRWGLPPPPDLLVGSSLVVYRSLLSVPCIDGRLPLLSRPKKLFKGEPTVNMER